ncbi:hypothetical protein AWB83_05948 [Caballeronia ptereochthonis]|uniref:Uncharacterized protein n=1 Tax=Caballeronia ptereochthonis TaxID=1777144 RepID=A0A158DVS0_9BURK|nr:hypothetical protein AWB83_05948 [Caballeronia ptereochthonis]
MLQHIDQYIERFDSIIVFQDASEIPSSDLRRLMNAANDMVDSIDARAALAKKINHPNARGMTTAVESKKGGQPHGHPPCFNAAVT